MRSCRAPVRATALLLLGSTAITACSGSAKTQQGLPPTTRTTVPARPSPSPTVGEPTGPCGWSAPPPVKHVMWIWMENRAYDDVLHSARQAPHLSSYARRCGLATNYRAVTHPSLPN